MAAHGIGRLALAAGMTLVLAGCEEGANPFAGLAGQPAAAGGTVAATAATTGAARSRDVEAPEVFSMSGEGLWDGRPSLGGIWVAHASVQNPERVVIRNSANGRSVVGALFRRERLNPGPSIQISSDAADALGLLAGQPAGLSIVALRREDLPEPVATAAPPDKVEAAATTAGTPVATTAMPQARPATAAAPDPSAADPIAASAAAAIAKAEGASEGGGAAANDAAEAEAAAAAPAPTWAERRARKRAERLAAELAAAKAAAAESAASPGPGASADGAVTESVLPEAGAGAAAASASISADPLRRAYVQIGIFSSQANAATAADQMKATGLTATLRKDEIAGKTYWRVIVGPAASVAERDALAARVRAIGYPDAYPVQN